MTLLLTTVYRCPETATEAPTGTSSRSSRYPPPVWTVCPTSRVVPFLAPALEPHQPSTLGSLGGTSSDPSSWTGTTGAQPNCLTQKRFGVVAGRLSFTAGVFDVDGAVETGLVGVWVGSG